MTVQTLTLCIAIGLPLASFALSLWGVRRGASRDELADLRGELQRLKAAHEECERERRALMQERVILLERLVMRGPIGT